MAIAKVQFKENASATPEVWMDTTQKTVTANTMLDGTTALKNDGTGITGNIASKSSSDLTASGATVTAPAGYYPSAASKSVASGSATTPATSITANPTISVNASGLITASVSGSQSVTPSVSAGYVSAGTAGTVSVSGSKTQQLSTQAAKTVAPTESEQTAVASGVYTTGAVKVGAVSSTYVGSGVARNDSDDLTASGATVTVPAGYYAETASKSVITATHMNPSASINSTTGLVTASHTQGTGYVTGGTTTGTMQLSTQAAATITPSTSQQTAVAAGKYTTGAVTVDPIPSQYIIPSGTKEITENGEGIDVSAYASVDVSVPSPAPNLQEKTVTPSDQTQVITADSGGTTTFLDGTVGLNRVSSTGSLLPVYWVSYINYPSPWLRAPVNGETYHLTFDYYRSGYDRHYLYDGDLTWSNGSATFTAAAGSRTLSMTISYEPLYTSSTYYGYIKLTSSLSDEDSPGSDTVSVLLTQQTSGYDALSKVTVNPIPSEYIVPAGTVQITQNGTVDVTQYASANVNVTDGTTVSENDVNFIDYDGTILYSYTASDFANLSALPANPSHAGLTAQGWNWSLSDAKTYIAQHNKLWIGQMYITSDGKTRIYITLDNPNFLSPYLAIAVNGTVVVDWGDNTTSNTVTGTSNTTLKYTLHEYATTGDYVIAITVTSGSFSFYGTNYLASLLRVVASSAELARNRIYSSSVTHIELGSQMSLGQYALFNCQGIKSITMPSSITSIGNYAFHNCYSLTSLTFSPGLTGTGNSLFRACYNLTSVAIPNTVTTIGVYFVADCISLSSITLPSSVTVIDGYAFNSCYNLSTIEMPSGSVTFGNYAFYNCVLITDLPIVYGPTAIPTYMFGYCYALKNITIPASITSIASGAFAYCYFVKQYHFLSTTPPTLANTNAFTGIQSDTKIYVPYSADHSVLEAYKTATNWSTYASRMEEEPQ